MSRRHVLASAFGLSAYVLLGAEGAEGKPPELDCSALTFTLVQPAMVVLPKSLHILPAGDTAFWVKSGDLRP